MKRITSFLRPLLLSLALFFCLSGQAYSLDVVLEWLANSESYLTGYRVYFKTGSSGDRVLSAYDGTGLIVEKSASAQPVDSGFEIVRLDLPNPESSVVIHSLNSLVDSGFEIVRLDLPDPDAVVVTCSLSGLSDQDITYFVVTAYADIGIESEPSVEIHTGLIQDRTSPTIRLYPTIDNVAGTIDVGYSEGNIQEAALEDNYAFSPSLLFRTGEGSDDISYLGDETYRLSMAFIPRYTVYTLTVTDITDQAGNPVVPDSVRINDNDDDGIADDWEIEYDFGDPSGDPDDDGLNNLEEYENHTHPNLSDTDEDGLPDLWEVAYGLDPTDGTGANGPDGDPDEDGMTNLDEFLNGHNPGRYAPPDTQPPEIREVHPHDGAGVDPDVMRIPDNTSFALRLGDLEGIDITREDSITFTIDDSVNPPYQRDLGDSAVTRIVKLNPDPDSQATHLWAVYDRALDVYGRYGYDTTIHIMIDAVDVLDVRMPQARFQFKIQTEEQYIEAQLQAPQTITSSDDGYRIIRISSNHELDGFEIVYVEGESLIPYIGPTDEIPDLNLPGVNPLTLPVNLQPPTVFSEPVKLVIPFYGEGDVRDLHLYLYNGREWVYAASSCNTGGIVQPGGVGWIVPGSLRCDDSSNPPFMEVQVYHFSGLQTGTAPAIASPATGSSLTAPASDGGGGGGCFITTASSPLMVLQSFLLIFALILFLVFIIYFKSARSV